MTEFSYHLDSYVYSVVAVILSIMAIVLMVRSMIFLAALLAVICFILGYLTWTLLEYVLHRWLLHGPMSRDHAYHHLAPADYIGAPNAISLGSGAILGIIFFCTMPMLYATTLLLGMVLGYRRYLQLHHLFHHTSPLLLNEYMAPLCRHHAVHHKMAARNFGVTTRLWDKAFNTTA